MAERQTLNPRRGLEEALPARSQISVAEVITLEFEAK